jgi:predicted deacylase
MALSFMYLHTVISKLEGTQARGEVFVIPFHQAAVIVTNPYW